MSNYRFWLGVPFALIGVLFIGIATCIAILGSMIVGLGKKVAGACPSH